MGYYTDYELDFKLNGNNSDEILAKIEEISPYEWHGVFSLYDVKWYRHEEHMRALSELYYNVLFSLEGNGEEKGDTWIEYYLGGKMQRSMAMMTFAPFDNAKLK